MWSYLYASTAYITYTHSKIQIKCVINFYCVKSFANRYAVVVSLHSSLTKKSKAMECKLNKISSEELTDKAMKQRSCLVKEINGLSIGEAVELMGIFSRL